MDNCLPITWGTILGILGFAFALGAACTYIGVMIGREQTLRMANEVHNRTRATSQEIYELFKAYDQAVRRKETHDLPVPTPQGEST